MSNVANVSKNVACEVSVTCGSNPNSLTGKNYKHTRFIYNSSVNPAYIEASMASKCKIYYTQKM